MNWKKRDLVLLILLIMNQIFYYFLILLESKIKLNLEEFDYLLKIKIMSKNYEILFLEIVFNEILNSNYIDNKNNIKQMYYLIMNRMIH